MKKFKFAILCLVVSNVFSCNKPEAVFFTDNSTALIASKTGWTATASSESPDGLENTGKASAIIDGNITTYWHTNYSSTPVLNYPHWVLIDIKSEKNIISVSLTNRQASTPNSVGIKRFKLEGSKDGTSFTGMGEFRFAITNNAQSFPVSSATAYRYLKITALEGQSATTPNTFLAEIDLFVTK